MVSLYYFTTFHQRPPTFLNTLNMLCELCDSLNVTDLLKLAKANSSILWGYDEFLYFEHHKRYDDLVNAASSGCELCLILQRQCEEEHINGSTREQEFRTMEAENIPMNLRVRIEASHLSSFEPFKEIKTFDHLIFLLWGKNFIDYSTKMTCILQTPKGIVNSEYAALFRKVLYRITSY